jgi:hypothetical protein
MRGLSLVLALVAVVGSASAGPLKIKQIIYEMSGGFGPHPTAYRVTLDANGGALYEGISGDRNGVHRGKIDFRDFARLSVLIQKVGFLKLKSGPIFPDAGSRQITVVTDKGRRTVEMTTLDDPPAFWAVDRLVNLLASPLFREEDPPPAPPVKVEDGGLINIEVFRPKVKL